MRKLKLKEGVDLANLFGPQDLHLRMIEGELKVDMTARGDEVILNGQPDAVLRAERILHELGEWTRDYYELKPDDITRALRATETEPERPLKQFSLDPTLTNSTIPKKGGIVPKSPAHSKPILRQFNSMT